MQDAPRILWARRRPGRAMMFAAHDTPNPDESRDRRCTRLFLEKRMRNRGVLLCRVLVALTSAVIPPLAAAQGPAARVQIQLAAAPASGRAVETPVQMELRSDTDPAHSWPVALDASEPV